MLVYKFYEFEDEHDRSNGWPMRVIGFKLYKLQKPEICHEDTSDQKIQHSMQEYV